MARARVRRRGRRPLRQRRPGRARRRSTPPSPTGSGSVASSASEAHPDARYAPAHRDHHLPGAGPVGVLGPARPCCCRTPTSTSVPAPAACRCCCRRCPTVDGRGRVAGRATGCVLAGGADVDPRRYGAVPRAGSDRAAPRPRRVGGRRCVDERARADVPVLGVCRGVQVLNVACGGTLHQHLPDVVGSDGHRPAPGTFGRRAGAGRARQRPGRDRRRRGRRALPPPPGDRPARRRAARLARAGDGTVEAVELAGRRPSPSACSGTPRRTATTPAVRRAGAGRRGSAPDPSSRSTRETDHRARQPGHRGGGDEVPPTSAEETDAAIARAGRGAARLARGRAGRPGPAAAPVRRGRRRRRRAPGRGSRSPTPGTPSATPGGRPATSATCCSTTRPRPSGCSASRSRWPAASTSPSASRSASSA